MPSAGILPSSHSLTTPSTSTAQHSTLQQAAIPDHTSLEVVPTRSRTRQASGRKRFHVPPPNRRLRNMAHSRLSRLFFPSFKDLQHADEDRKGSVSDVVAESSIGVRVFGNWDDRGRMVEAYWRCSRQWTGEEERLKKLERREAGRDLSTCSWILAFARLPLRRDLHLRIFYVDVVPHG